MALIQEKGYHHVTMEEVAEAGEVSRATLYSYFPVKEALVARYIHNRLTAETPAILAALAPVPDVMERLTMFIAGSADWIEPFRKCYGAYLQYRFTHPQSPDCGSTPVLLGLLQEAQQQGHLYSDRSAERLQEDLYALLTLAVIRWLRQGGRLQSQYLDTWNFFLQGAGVPKPKPGEVR